MLTVKNIFESKQKPFNYIRPELLVIEALNVLNTLNLSYVVVMDENAYKGIFSERDYTRNVILKGRNSSNTTVQEVMTTDFPIVMLTDTVEHCMNMMNSHRTRYLLAYNNQQFVGVVTIHDLLRQVISNKENVFDHQVTNSLLDEYEGNRIY